MQFFIQCTSLIRGVYALEETFLLSEFYGKIDDFKFDKNFKTFQKQFYNFR